MDCGENSGDESNFRSNSVRRRVLVEKYKPSSQEDELEELRKEICKNLSKEQKHRADFTTDLTLQNYDILVIKKVDLNDTIIKNIIQKYKDVGYSFNSDKQEHRFMVPIEREKSDKLYWRISLIIAVLIYIKLFSIIEVLFSLKEILFNIGSVY